MMIFSHRLYDNFEQTFRCKQDRRRRECRELENPCRWLRHAPVRDQDQGSLGGSPASSHANFRPSPRLRGDPRSAQGTSPPLLFYLVLWRKFNCQRIPHLHLAACIPFSILSQQRAVLARKLGQEKQGASSSQPENY